MHKNFVKLLSCFLPKKQWRIDFRFKYGMKNLQNYGIKHIYNGEDGQNIISNLITSDKPCLVCRFGGTEMRIVDYYLKNMHKDNVVFPDKLKNMIGDLSGFFPANDYLLSRFVSEFIELAENIDVLAVWDTKSEKTMCEKYLNKNAKLVQLSALDTIVYDEPWSQHLQGKKVLLIHPFEDTIKSQFEKRKLLFKNSKILPEFELKTIKAVQGLADSKKDLPFKTWFEALEFMKKQIDKTDFDIAIIGAGAYGIFLADYCKRIGKKAIHMGGSTQLLFGIKGKRWETEYTYIRDNYYNEYWVRPSENEKPKGSVKVEGGCYW